MCYACNRPFRIIHTFHNSKRLLKKHLSIQKVKFYRRRPFVWFSQTPLFAAANRVVNLRHQTRVLASNCATCTVHPSPVCVLIPPNPTLKSLSFFSSCIRYSFPSPSLLDNSTLVKEYILPLRSLLVFRRFIL